MGNQPHKHLALRVTGVKPESPAARAELAPYTDFVVGVMGVHSEFNLVTDFFRFLVDNEGKEVTLMVLSLLTGIQRIVALVPSRTWPNANGLTGLSTRAEDVRFASANTFRISGVKNEDLRDVIKLNTDFFLGVEEIIFRDLQELKERLAQLPKCHVVLFSMDTKQVRLVPANCHHGLGLEFYVGILHNFSSVYQKTVLVELQKTKIKEKYGELEDGGDEVVVYKDGQRVDVEQLMASYGREENSEVPVPDLETPHVPETAEPTPESQPADGSSHMQI